MDDRELFSDKERGVKGKELYIQDYHVQSSTTTLFIHGYSIKSILEILSLALSFNSYNQLLKR